MSKETYTTHTSSSSSSSSNFMATLTSREPLSVKQEKRTQLAVSRENKWPSQAEMREITSYKNLGSLFRLQLTTNKKEGVGVMRTCLESNEGEKRLLTIFLCSKLRLEQLETCTWPHGIKEKKVHRERNRPPRPAAQP